ncbi:hypothetical protein G6F56_003000 [Rhizopus delemar]|uniref:DNA helicase n=1 Tax=Rhizopus stolonifer TaxID=4846 RepID=A0A367KPW6_RHIST|nr:hypothetical protein G6F56_003000 [Rhizopus delemar]RCI04238.1 hypothetical protein CU098_009625 [Rhizopus stolonifer]
MSPPGFLSPTGPKRTITSFFKKTENDSSPKVPVRNILKTGGQSFASPSTGPFSLTSTNPFKKRAAVVVEEEENDKAESEDSTRVLRKRNRPFNKRVILFSSDEEDDEEQEALPEKDEQPQKKRTKFIQISDDDEDDEDESFVDNNAKMNERLEGTDKNSSLEKIKKLYPTIHKSEIEQVFKDSGYNMVKTVMELSVSGGEKKMKRTDDVVESDKRGRAIIEKSNKNEDMLKFFNEASSQDIQDITGCKSQTADRLIEKLRPFADVNELEEKLRREKGMSAKYMESYLEMNKGYYAVDQIIKEIERIGGNLKDILNVWKGLESESAEHSRLSTPIEGEVDEKAGLHLVNIDISKANKSKPQYQDAMNGYLTEQPKIINKEMIMKDYQLLGINWMLLLYRKNISGILADEMGLGKTAQVINFLGRLYELGEHGPHLIIVPASTIENWMREFERFCPTLTVKMYQGSMKEREELRYELNPEDPEEDYQVIVTTYSIATGNAEDRSFLRRLNSRSIILDEGHMIKNCMSARYKHLMKFKAPFRLLMTGTPLQNNLQELVSLLTFIMPKMFVEYEEEIRSIFKIRTNNTTSDADQKRGTIKVESSVQLLSQKRIARAKQMMTPFVLRRKKTDVLKDLPSKFHETKRCCMTETQLAVYNNIITQTRKSYGESGSDMEAQFDNMSNIVIHLRKAADHPLLFRHLYTDDLLKKMTKDIMRDTINKYSLQNNEWMDSGKVNALKEILSEKIAKGEKMLLFSQFTSMLDILELVMATLDIKFLRLDGETKVLERQAMIDEFNEDESIPIFLLSTKAGGFGINLTSANVVILYDLDFNPHNDKQAEDRAHRVGQTKDVTVIKLICSDSIEEHILRKTEVKLMLDKNISSEEYVELSKEEEKQSLRSILKETIFQSEKKSLNKV